MRIGFDAKRLFNNHTGLGNYSRTLVRNLHNHYTDLEIVLFVPKVKLNKHNEWFTNQDRIKVVESPKNSNAAYWRSYSLKKLAKEEKLDIFHGLSNELPFGALPKSVKWIVTIHDLIFKVFKAQYPLSDRLIYNRKSKSACLKADAIVAISKSTSNDIARFYGPDKSKIHQVYQSCNLFTPAQSPTRDYFLFVSGLNKRKGLMDILKAFVKLEPKDRSLLKVVGKGGQYEDELKQFAKQNELMEYVEFLGNVENKDLLAYYQHAIALIYPSYYEGFGIPIIESLSCHTPVITSNVSSMPEAGGNHCLYITPGDITGLTSAIKEIPSFPLNKSKLQKHLETFNETTTTQANYALYERLLNI